MITCVLPARNHVHWSAQPGFRFILEAFDQVGGVGHIRPFRGGRSRIAPLADLVVCGPGAPIPAVLPEDAEPTPEVSEAEALTEMLAELEDDAELASGDMRAELVSRLAHIAA